MKYSAQNLAKGLAKILKENPEKSTRVVKDFVIFCKKKKLEYLSKSILSYLKLEIEKQEDVETLKISSSIELEQQTINNIKNLLKVPQSSKTEIIINSEIVAGFIANYQNQIIDVTVNNNLNILKNKLTDQVI